MVPAGIVFFQFNGSQAFHMIDEGELAIFGTHNGHFGFNLVGADHDHSPSA
jgi:hypothetical protein